ncbi:MAG: GIY-YIG nuclease family protein [Butyrivibrio sp.]|nr:GIY-YIG nuclease family protein [Butyrivibrio sp.]
MEHYAYILKCADDTYYCGYTNDLENRIKKHNQGKGAKYTRGRLPVVLVYYEVFASKEEAMSREWHLKQLSRAQKELIISEKSTDNTNTGN